MRPAIYSPGDDPKAVEKRSFLAGISFVDDEVITRQEFKDESDINWLLNRYGALPPQRPQAFGEVDYDTDLLSAYMAVQEAQDAFAALPPQIRDQFDSWAILAEKLASGELASVNAVANHVTGHGTPSQPPAGDGISSPSPAGGSPPAGTPVP